MKKLITLMTLLLCAVVSSWADTETIFSADAIVTSETSFPASATTEITSAQATITGGKMYAINGQGSAKNLMRSAGFCMTNNNTIFKIELDEALKVGDVITASSYGGDKNGTSKGLWVTATEERPGSAPDCSAAATTPTTMTANFLNYTVTEGSEYVGTTTLYVHRAAGATQDFDLFKITRESAPAVPAAPTFSPASGDIEGLSSITISGSGTIYYQLTNSAEAPEIPAELPGDWTQATSVAVPNATATIYLHAFAHNTVGNSEITTATFNVTESTTFTYGLTQADLTTSEGIATTTTYAGEYVTLTMSNAAHGSSNSTRNVTNGTTSVTAAATACQRNTLCSGASDFEEDSYYGFTLEIAKGYKMNISQFFGDLYYDNSRSGKYKFAVYSGDTKVWEAGSSDYVATGGGNNSTKTLDTKGVEKLQGLTGTIQMRMVWYQNGSSSYVALKDFNIKGSLEVDERVTYDLTATVAPAEGGSVTFDPVGGSYEEGTEVTMTAVANDGYYFVNWTNASEEEVATTAAYTHTMGAEAASYTANFAKYPVISFALGESGAMGTVPGSVYTTNGTFTTPSNNSLYVAGKTLTKWSDGANEYAVGAEISDITADITLTPVFEENALSVKSLTDETTVNFPFIQANGAPVMAAEGNTTMMVAQATVNEQFIDILMSVDATSGKFNNNQGAKNACQINATTTITLPAAPGMRVTIDKEYSTSYLGEESNTGNKSNKTTTWTYNGIENEVTLTINESNTYPNQMTVVYPALPANTTVLISHESGYRTFASKYPTDWSSVEGVTAYTASVSENNVTFTKVEGSVPAGTGLLLKGTASETPYTVNIPSETPAAVSNAFVGVLTDTEVAADNFVLMGSGDYGVGFYSTPDVFTVGANTAYLPASVAEGRSFIWFESETTGIQAPVVKDLNAGEIYTIAGQRVAKPTKGLYIQNGKKVVMK